MPKTYLRHDNFQLNKIKLIRLYKWSKNCNFVLMKIENDSKNFIIDKIRPIDIKDELDIENKIIKTKNNILETGLKYEIEKLSKQIKEYEINYLVALGIRTQIISINTWNSNDVDNKKWRKFTKHICIKELNPSCFIALGKQQVVEDHQ